MAKEATAVGFTITMKLDKSTKGTHVYSEEGDDPKIPSVYIKRKAIGGDTPPAEIEVIVKAK